MPLEPIAETSISSAIPTTATLTAGYDPNEVFSVNWSLSALYYPDIQTSKAYFLDLIST